MKMDVFNPLLWVNIPTILAFVVVFLLYYYGIKQQNNLPPRPWSFPLIGSIPSLAVKLYRTGDEPEQLLAKMAGRYGEVFSMNIGTTVIIVANGYKTIKEALQNRDLSDRPRSRVFEETALDEGIVVASGKSWIYQRKFTTNTLRSFGLGKNSFEGQISAEAQTLVDEVSQNKGKPFDSRTLIIKSTSNILCSVVFGKRYVHSDPNFQYVLSLIIKVAHKVGSGGTFLFLPIMRYLFPQRYNEIKSIMQEFVAFIESKTKEHEELFDETSVDDFIDVYLREIKLAKNEIGDRFDYINNKSLIGTTFNLFLAGVETTTSTLGWALLYMIAFPKIQAKVQEEIDTVVGRQRMPKWNDRLKLPYTEAVLLETQRIRTVVPLGVPHLASKDTILAGYHVPKDAIIVPNLWAAHNDPDVWPEPDQFKPERFLDENGLLCGREEVLPFGTGRRVCIGENLAKMEVFLIFTCILHRFIIKHPPGRQPCSLKGISGMAYTPAPYEITAEFRN